ncbi:MAG: site-specific integrase [Eubacteriales bacterium]
MSVSKDNKTGKWMAQIRIENWKGEVIHKKKRGFKTKKEGLEWEEATKKAHSASMGMYFQNFIVLYFEDMKHRLKESTLENKHWLIDKKITPFFGKMPLDQINANDIRRWQNKMTAFRDEKDKPYSQTYLKTVNNQLTAVFNYAVKYYDLKENPCHKAGSMGKKDADEMLFWTKAEFDQFAEAVREKPTTYTAFMVLYYTGIRIGELAALTRADVDLEKATITVNKSFQKIKGKDVITDPKTPKSNRVVTIPKLLVECLRDYFDQRYELEEDQRIFEVTKGFMGNEMKRGCVKSGVKKIRVHDCRHSHASLLIEMGFSPLLIADRLGHEKVETTLNTYSHLYPSKQIEVAEKLDELG